ncbi:MAG: hypothetical protein R3190_14315, partial [Thermoanaerobaculia bacterium]|nr:hypothetical protein [Thermoanaerobaculia bacterium]
MSAESGRAPDEERWAALGATPFRAPWWLRNRHLQTAWSPLLRRSPAPPARRRSWPTPDGDRVTVWTREQRPAAPWVLVLHGLEGCARSNYVLGLRNRVAALDWNVAVLEFRSCDGVLNAAPRLYHSGETSDLDFAVRELTRRHQVETLFVAGFSLGGNVLGKWLGEQGSSVPSAVAGAALICPPFDLTVSGPAIDRALGGLYVRR